MDNYQWWWYRWWSIWWFAYKNGADDSYKVIIDDTLNVLELCDDDDANVVDDNNHEDETEDDINDDDYNDNIYCSTQSYYNHHFCKLIL